MITVLIISYEEIKFLIFIVYINIIIYLYWMFVFLKTKFLKVILDVLECKFVVEEEEKTMVV